MTIVELIPREVLPTKSNGVMLSHWVNEINRQSISAMTLSNDEARRD